MNTNFNINQYYFSRQKHFTDVLLSIILGSIAIPIILIICCTILSFSGKPIIFKQKRLGKNKKVFTILKFRTMKKNAEILKPFLENINEAPKPMFKLKHDPRFVGIGQFLSKTALDELPQLINIIKGEMSLVGPRPLPIQEANQLSESWQYRFQVKPGLFSFWSLSDQRFESLKKWQSLEKKTLLNGGISFDLKIIIQTIIKQLSKL